MQGMLEIMWRLEQMLREISGMDRVSLQPGAGSAAIYANVSMIRAYHASRGEAAARRDHHHHLLAPIERGLRQDGRAIRVITLYPDADGYPDLEALRAAVSERTAALLITNPEDTGIFNPRIAEFVQVVHDAGGLCSYDQANANGILGITRARDAGFDLCHFNLHKTFSHAARLRRTGAPARCGVTASAGPLPARPDGRVSTAIATTSTTTGPQSIGKVRPFVRRDAQPCVRAYAWIMSLGADGLREVAEIAVLNNNYLMTAMLADPRRQRPVRRGPAPHRAGALQWEELTAETGVALGGDRARAADFGVALLDEPPPVRGARAVHARADRVVLAGRPRRVRQGSWPTSPRRRTAIRSPRHGAARQHHPHYRRRRCSTIRPAGPRRGGRTSARSSAPQGAPGTAPRPGG